MVNNKDVGVGVVVSGFLQLLISQLSTRVVSFLLNLLIARHLSPEDYGLSAVQFHLITTTILLFSREGLRRGCLRFKSEAASLETRHVISVASLALPAGVLVTSVVVGGVLHMSHTSPGSTYRTAVKLHGIAAVLELASEPLYMLALVNLRFKLRAGVDTAALLAKSGLTLLLVSRTDLDPAICFSLAQIAFALVTFLAYAVFTGPAVITALSREAKRGAWPLWGAEEKEVLWMSSLFTFQSMEKQVLSEGSKLVLVTVQSQYNQGVYGLVSNLGSLLVRTLLQPLEEIAFATFSRFQVSINEAAEAQVGGPSPPAFNGSSTTANAEAETASTVPRPDADLARLADVLCLLVKCVCLLGLLSASFGPAYAYALIRLVYSTRWSETEAPAVLACYSVYILLLSVNGVTEAFVHAVLDSRGLQQTNVLLVAFAVVHIAASVAFISMAGATGLVLADAVNMVLRIACSLWYIRRQFQSLRTFKLTQLMPHSSTVAAFAAVSVVTLISQHVFLPGGAGSSIGTLSFLKKASGHVLVGLGCLAAVGGVTYKFEHALISNLRGLRSPATGAAAPQEEDSAKKRF